MEQIGGVFVFLLLGGAVLWWLWVTVVHPLRELGHELERIASGNFKPVILAWMPPFFRKAATDLRRIAERLAKQKALIANEEFSLSMILESMTEGVVVTSRDLKIRLLNKAAASMFGVQGNLTGLLLQEVFVSHELQGMARRAASTSQLQYGELTLTVPGRGERCHLLVTAVSLITPERISPDGVLLVFHDVTRLRELESVRREFVANVSHEFRTPLSIINGYLETLEEGGLEPEMLECSVTVMKRHAERLNRLIEDLLTISRMEEKGVVLEKSAVDVGVLLRNVIAQMDHEIGKRGATVLLDVPGSLPQIDLDAYRVEQVFSNLLANALRHGLHGLSRGSSKQCIVEISAGVRGGDLAVSFRDHGPGIPLQDQGHLFDRFYRVGGDRDRQTGGTGLGLSIVKNIVTAHGGRVELESVPGQGARFTVLLPLSSRGLVS
jgi:two-component system phosphate regulon sensor histidine kinase PhoR